ncbi:MAG TPA: BTAD domain-containing putative transcriptional regulator [Ktedonobacteraceae bacterium]|nr:BTAD domain-containing putative transcriptional regulator [Ktedonobacteraceae bacterium]
MHEGPKPLLRVYTFGAFELVWHATPSTAEALWESRTSARTLFKLLLCAPGRQAPKSVLAGILWPEVDEERARESLRSACKVLRKVLRTASGEELLDQRTPGEILHLAEHARLWVDADAFEELAARASRATSEDAALSLWEEASALLRGEFFAEDQSAEWAHHRLVKKRQQELWLARCRMIRHLADLYVRRGQTSLAEEMLESHLLHFPTDQDALYRLLLLLEQQGCFEQASILYERTRRTLEARGKQPTHHVRQLYEGFQQAVSSRARTLSSRMEGPSPGTALTVAKQARPALPRGGLQGSKKGRASTVSQVLSLLGTDGRPDTPLNVLRALLEPEEEETQDMSQLSRRQLLELGIAALISRLAQLDGTRISAVEREALGRALGQSIADGWKLFHTAGNVEVLAVGQLQLSLIHQAHALLRPSTRSYLYAGAYGLIGSALHLQEREEEALHAYHHAYHAATATGDPWYIAQNLISQADAYQSLGRLAESIQTLEEALGYLGQTEEEHRRTRAHLLGCWADAALTMGDYSLAQHKLDESAIYLERLSASEEFDRGSWLHLAGKYAFATGNYPTAIAYFEQALTEAEEDWLIRRILVLLPKMAAYACEGDLDACASTAEAASSALGALNASSMNRTFTMTTQEILKAFPNDTRLQSLMRDAQHHLPIQASS